MREARRTANSCPSLAVCRRSGSRRQASGRSRPADRRTIQHVEPFRDPLNRPVDRLYQSDQALVVLTAFGVAQLLVRAPAGVEVRLHARQQRVDQAVLKPRVLMCDQGDGMQMPVGIGALVQLREASAKNAAGEVGNALPSQADRRQHVAQPVVDRPDLEQTGNARAHVLRPGRLGQSPEKGQAGALAAA